MSIDGNTAKNKNVGALLSYYQLKVFDLQKQAPGSHCMPGAGTDKKPPRMPELTMPVNTAETPEKNNLVFKNVVRLSTLASASATSTAETPQTADAMGGTVAASPLLFTANLQKMLAAARKHTQVSAAPVGVGAAVSVAQNTPKPPRNH